MSYSIGAVVFPGFELLDLFGPLEMFGLVGNEISIVLMAETPGAISSSHGPSVLAEQPMKSTEPYDLLLLPGGLGTRREINNEGFLTQYGKLVDRTKKVATVCTGSVLLAKTGRLDGLKATSNKLAFDWVADQRPQVNWIREARWVEDGQFITSSGVAAGMDMAISIIRKEFGEMACKQVIQKAEYIWNEESNHDPFAQQEHNNG